MNKAKILPTTDQNLQLCGKKIREGKLVAFPTETVYGLGANALDLEACLNIYKMKNRPLTDPIIVHISKKEDIFPLVQLNEKEEEIMEILAEKFWPGPLTMVFRRSKIIPKQLTANRDFIGIRIPNHKTALKFIIEAQRPIAAPSANLFNHISPVTAKHVFNDFFDQELDILDDGKTTLGIESTVVKISENELLFYRLGSLPQKDIENYLIEKGFKNLNFIQVKKNQLDNEEQISPGQFIKHYSPNKTTFLMSLESKQEFDNKNLFQTIFIDFNRKFLYMKEKFLDYLDLSPNGSLFEAMNNFYYFLHLAEENQFSKYILIIDIKMFENEIQKEREYFESVYDKIFRSCSGIKVKINQFQQCYLHINTTKIIYYPMCQIKREYSQHTNKLLKIKNEKFLIKQFKNYSFSNLQNKNKSNILLNNKNLVKKLSEIQNRNPKLPEVIFQHFSSSKIQLNKKNEISHENMRIFKKLKKMSVQKKKFF